MSFSNKSPLISQSSQFTPSTNLALSTTTLPETPLITHPPSHLALRQTQPQDCENAIIASVDRATVEISRTIIALSATFSEQLSQASISASAGIKSAQDSAASSIGDIVRSADAAASTATASLDVAERKVESVSAAMEEVKREASSEVAALRESLSVLRESVGGVQATRTVVSVSSEQTPSTQPFTSVQGDPQSQSSSISLAPGQIAGIVIGSILATLLLSVALYFATRKLLKRRRGRDSYLDKEFIAASSSQKKLPWSRSSSTLRTGNGVTIKFGPPVSSSDLTRGSVG